MSIKNILLLFILCYFLVLLQTTFFVHFSILGIVPNIVFVLVILWNFFEKEKSPLGIFCALFSGLFLDIFSSKLIGFYVFSLLAIAIFIKLFIRKHVRIPLVEKI